ncbi:MAG: hypothetical protein RR063_04795 [Anaerovoracaceae bacterium]
MFGTLKIDGAKAVPRQQARLSGLAGLGWIAMMPSLCRRKSRAKATGKIKRFAAALALAGFCMTKVFLAQRLCQDAVWLAVG